MDVFVYGTLTDPARVAGLVDSYVFVGPAVLEGMHLVEGELPTLAPGGRAAGRLLRTDEVAAIDDYEGVDRDLYVRVSVPREPADAGHDPSEPDEAAVYVADPGALGVDDVSWPGDGDLADRVRRYVEANDVRVRPGHGL